MAFIDTLQKLKGHIPDSILAQLPGLLKFGIDGPKRMSHLLGQCMHESAKFTVFSENLNYSASGLLKIFPKYFTASQANLYARQPSKIANRVYANRMGNGDEASGDGYKYRGRGALQTTGKSNYTELGKFLGVDLVNNPDLVATVYPVASAAFFFMNNNLWTICDKGVDVNTITQVTKRVNGGTHGLAERIKYTQYIYKILTS